MELHKLKSTEKYPKKTNKENRHRKRSTSKQPSNAAHITNTIYMCKSREHFVVRVYKKQSVASQNLLIITGLLQ